MQIPHKQIHLIARVSDVLCSSWLLVTVLICSISNGSGGSVYSYDALNRLTKVDYGNGSVISYAYDAAGNRLSYSGVMTNDTTLPNVAISTPTSGPYFTTANSTINLGGSSSDDVGVILVTWANDQGGSGTATGTTNWNINGIALQSGTNIITVTAHDFSGNVQVATLAVVLSSSAPKYTIALSASPPGGGTVKGAGTFAGGTSRTVTATANSGYSFVDWTENGSQVSALSSYTFSLNSDRNLVANFTLASGSSLLTVTVNGAGNVAPNYSGKVLQIGKPYTITAKPGVGYVFAGWNGGVSASTPKLTFIMQNNMVLNANFVPNPFMPAVGNYVGLFYSTNGDGVTVSNAGYITAQVTAAGSFSAKLQQGAKTYPLSGQFGVDGVWGTGFIKGAPGMGASLQLSLDGGDEITGQVSNSVWTAEILANRAVYSKTNAAPKAGQYTLVIPGSHDSANLPGGHGAAAVSVSSLGAVNVGGTLGEGTKLTESTFISKDGQWPLYAALYSKQGILIGWLTFTNEPATTNDIEGVIAWIKPGQTGTKLYPHGFDWPYSSKTNNAFGSGFTNKTPLLSWTDGVAILENGNLTGSTTNGLTIGAGGKATGTNKLTLTVTTSGVQAGMFKGSLVNPETGKAIPVNGVLLQKQDVGYGSFIGTNQSGGVSLLPH